MAESTLPRRARLANQAGVHFGGDRDLYQVFGYPRRLDVEQFTDIYLRQDITKRIINAFPDATWREEPDVLGAPAFRAAFAEIAKKHRLWRSFHRLDRLSGLGHYGVLVLGLDGGEPMYTPARRADYSLLYVQPHSERTAEVTQWEDDPTNERFGLPKMYRITTGVNWTGAGAGQKTFNVHWTRCIHVAENPLEDISIGTPRLEAVYNRLMDLDKLLGGSAEMYWQNVAMLMAFMADSEVEFSPDAKEDMESQIEEMQHGLRRFLRLRGMEAENLAPGLQGADPGTHIEKQLDMIAGATGIPKRILIGSESGELASSQDENNWQSRTVERREQFAGPSIVEEFIGRAQRLGIVPSGFKALEWPESDSLGEEVRANIAVQRTEALNKYVNALGADDIVSPNEFRETFLGLDALPQEPVLPDEADEAAEEVQQQFNAHKASVK